MKKKINRQEHIYLTELNVCDYLNYFMIYNKISFIYGPTTQFYYFLSLKIRVRMKTILYDESPSYKINPKTDLGIFRSF